MRKINENITIDPDISEIALEEVADIPENISLDRAIDERSTALDSETSESIITNGEEITDISHDVKEPVIVEDDYRANLPGGKHTPISGGLDISSLASEVDGLTRVKAKETKPSKEGPEANIQKREENVSSLEKPIRHHISAAAEQPPKPVEDSSEIVIHEDDDIDIDYYSLEELEGTAGMDLPEPGVDVPMAAVEEKGLEEKPDQDMDLTRIVDDTPPRSEKDVLMLEIPDDVIGKTMEELELGEWESIDLLEAEKIANEDIIFLREEDLIEELEEFDLIPIKVEAEKKSPHANKQKPSAPKEESSKAPPMLRVKQEETPPISEPAPHTRPAAIPEMEAGVSPEGALQEVKAIETPISQLLPSDDAVGNIKEIKDTETSLDIDALEGVKESVSDKAPGLIQPEVAEVKQVKPQIEELPDFIEDFAEAPPPATAADIEEIEVVSDKAPDLIQPEVAEVKQVKSQIEELPDFIEDSAEAPLPATAESENLIRAIDFDEEGELISLDLEEDLTIDDFSKNRETEAQAEKLIPPIDIQETQPPGPTINREQIPEELLRVEPTGGPTIFIDDELVEKELPEVEKIFEVTDLERIASEVVEIIEGEPKILSEADIADDLDKIARVMRGQAPAFEDLLIDMEGEYTFKDDEMDVIDNTFASEGYSKYIGAIDDLTGKGRGETVSTAMELLGLEMGELEAIEQHSFRKGYDNIDIDGILAATRTGLDQPPSDLDILKRCTYIVAREGSILEEEQRSIEEDINSESAVIFEESVNEIREKLGRMRAKRGTPVEEAITDISDRVIIMENGRDVERFVESMPEAKRNVMSKLLKYLDGLFEKLPEDVIKNFANSEYFDLYSKVMQDLGI